jgi:CPA1 family monovalent cation:H+ antiporter
VTGLDLNLFDVAALLVVIAAVLGFINYRLLGLPQTLSLTIMGALASVAALLLDHVTPHFHLGAAIKGFLGEVDFPVALLQGMLSFLLFAGALHVDLSSLIKRRWAVIILAVFGTIASTVLIGFGFYWLCGLFDLDLSLLWCLVFGALISPTDPVAVMGILKRAGMSESVEAKVAGESLFNDGIGIVIFSIVLGMAMGGDSGESGGTMVMEAGKLFLIEAGGGAVLGLVVGWIGYQAMKRVDEHNLEVLISLAIVLGGYSLAQHLHVSGPVGMAAAGILIGNYGTAFAMSDNTRRHLLSFWSLIDETLNSILFLLIGLEVVAIVPSVSNLTLGALGILLALTARAISVGVPLVALKPFGTFSPGAFPILLWGGLRGGISIALALSLPADSMAKPVILTVTYVTVIFSVVVQGSTVGLLARKLNPGRSEPLE